MIRLAVSPKELGFHVFCLRFQRLQNFFRRDFLGGFSRSVLQLLHPLNPGGGAAVHTSGRMDRVGPVEIWQNSERIHRQFAK